MSTIRFVAVVFFFGSLLWFSFSPQAVYPACGGFADLLHNGAFALADKSGGIISSCNTDSSFIPASIIKIPASLAALHILGDDFRFQTLFYQDARNNLYIEGEGDPFLVSEEVKNILLELKRLGVNEINGIFIDNSRFALHGETPGRGESDNPYDSPASATGVNFNTVNIRVNAQGFIESAEPQTPTLPIMKELGKGLQQGTYRINICRKGCEPDKQTARYTAELFRELQRRMGIAGSGPSGRRGVPADGILIYRHENSRTLEQMVTSILEYSNNYAANMTFLACGIKQYGYPATWDKARRAVRDALKQILGPVTAAKIILDDGSGLSRRNSISADAMISVLVAFYHYRQLMPEKKGLLLKSGTLEGVYNYAGYMDREKPFVIFLNQELNTRDRILQRLLQLAGHSEGK